MLVDYINVPTKSILPIIFTIGLFWWILTCGCIPFKLSDRTAGYFRYMSGFNYCFHGIVIYYYQYSSVHLIFGEGSSKCFLFTVLVSLLIGTVLWLLVGKRMKTIVA